MAWLRRRQAVVLGGVFFFLAGRLNRELDYRATGVRIRQIFLEIIERVGAPCNPTAGHLHACSTPVNYVQNNVDRLSS